MNCSEIASLLPLRGDSQLGEQDQRLLEEHLRACEACRREEAALAESRQALGSLKVPALSPSEVDRIVGAAMPSAPARPARWRGGWWSHAAAVMVGVGLMAVGRGCQASDDFSGRESAGAAGPGEPGVSAEQVAELSAPTETRWREVEVPVERIVEVRVEVPVEKIVYRDRPVMHALQPRWDAQLRAAGALSDAALLTARWVDRAYTQWERRTPEPEPKLLATAPKPPAKPIPLAATLPRKERTAGRARAGQTHLEVRRMDGRVTLRTRGSLAQVVPVLIDTLDSDDPAVVAAAVDRLESIRAGFGARAVELRPEPLRPARRGHTLRALLSSRGRAVRASEMDDADLWRGWWQRQRTEAERAKSAASI